MLAVVAVGGGEATAFFSLFFPLPLPFRRTSRAAALMPPSYEFPRRGDPFVMSFRVYSTYISKTNVLDHGS